MSTYGIDHVFDNDEDVQHAIASLEASTRSFEEQSRHLRAQRRMLQSYGNQSSFQDDEETSVTTAVQEMERSRWRQVTFLDNKARANLDASLRATCSDTNKITKAATSIINEKLRSDDRRLEALDQLNDMTTHDVLVEIDSSSHRNVKLLDVLRLAMEESLKTRLDRTYSMALQKPQTSQDDADSKGLAPEVQADLESLYLEIDSVVSLLVEHEHSQPVSTALENLRFLCELAERRQKQSLKSSIIQMTSDLNKLVDFYERIYSHKVLIQLIRDEDSISQSATSQSRTISSKKETDTSSPMSMKLLSQLCLATNDDGKPTPHAVKSHIGGLIAEARGIVDDWERRFEIIDRSDNSLASVHSPAIDLVDEKIAEVTDRLASVATPNNDDIYARQAFVRSWMR